MENNTKQKEVIGNIEGVYIVDAGAGTGKTHTITQRYINILNNNINPENILLITFTKNAATQMKEKVISKINYDKKADVITAPILNFDSFCSKIVSQHGLNAPKLIGIDDNLSGYKLISESSIQRRMFNKFFNQFLERNEDRYFKLLTTIASPQEIQYIIEKLLSKGIYPTKNGWFLDSQEKIVGDYNTYKTFFDELNQPIQGKKQSKLSSAMKNILKKNVIDFPEDLDYGKQINSNLSEIAFYDERDELFEFIHHIYFEYIKYMIRENTMTFSLVAMFAFLILYYEDEIRDKNSFNYVMVDEFQDTNEMQFMLILLLLKKPNLCVVGDWKQGIYGFRNATITNIREFKEKIQQYKNKLNQDKNRISFDISNVVPLEFDINYRSSQNILNFSEKSLTVKATQDEELDVEEIKKDIVSLKSNFDYEDVSEIKLYKAKDKETEISFILEKIQNLVGQKEIKYFEDGEYKKRLIEYRDIAILSRNRIFGLEIQKKAFEYNISAVYDGGIKLFEEESAILLLAWLKLILFKDNKFALIPILEKEGYTYLQIKYILENKKYPEEILEFRNHLISNKNIISYVVDEILKRYNFNDSISNTLVTVLEQIFHSTLISISDLIVFIEDNIENGETYNVEFQGDENSITIQTIHGSKGLEYPVVFVVNCNQSNFPSNNSEKNSITFNEMVGLRNKKLYSSDHSFVFDNWKSYLVNFNLFSDLDEERRLLYVAITRAMYDVYITSHKPSLFFSELSNKSEDIEDSSIKKQVYDVSKNSSDISIKTKDFANNRILSVHDLLEIKPDRKGRGKEFGSIIHKMAFRYVNDLSVGDMGDVFKTDFNNIKSFIDSLRDSKLKSEIDCSLPINDILVRGIIDLVVEYDDSIEIIDWKTDLDKSNLDQYKKQLSVYYYVVKSLYSNKKVSCKIFWTFSGETESVDILEWNEIVEIVETLYR